MATTELRFEWRNDEAVDVYIDENFLCNLNHDDHGWSGMSDFQSYLTKIAHRQGWTISVLHAPEDEY